MPTINLKTSPADEHTVTHRVAFVSHAHKGDRIRLVYSPYTLLKPGAEGTIDHIDAIGTIHVSWDDGHRLGLVPGEDRFEIEAKR